MLLNNQKYCYNTFTVTVHTHSEINFLTALLRCTFEGYLPSSSEYEIQWRNNDGTIITHNISYIILPQHQQDQLTSNLIIPSLSSKDEGNYTCELLSYDIAEAIEARIKGIIKNNKHHKLIISNL